MRILDLTDLFFRRWHSYYRSPVMYRCVILMLQKFLYEGQFTLFSWKAVGKYSGRSRIFLGAGGWRQLQKWAQTYFLAKNWKKMK